MNTPSKLHFRAWRKSEVVFALHDWRPLKGMAIIVDPKGDRQAINLVLPGMQVQGQRGLFPTFPGALPAEIEEITLLPPPCRTTRQEEEALRAEAVQARRNSTGAASRGSSLTLDWERVWLQHRDTILLPKAEDDARLDKRLAAFKFKMRHAYEARKAELEQWRTRTIGQMIYLGGGRFYPRLGKSKPADMSEEVERELRLLETYFTRPLSSVLGRPHGGYLNWTREVARHEPAIRNRVLHRRWARETGINLPEIQSEKAAFLRWYRAMCPHPPAPSRQPTCLLGGRTPEGDAWLADMVLCAEVRYRVRFTDGSHVWLADCPMRQPLLTPGEQWVGASTNAKPAFTGRTTEQEHSSDDIRGLHQKADQLLAGNQKIHQTVADGNQKVIKVVSAEGDVTRETVQQESAKVLSDTKTLKDLAGEQATTRDKWAENPLGSREASSDYLLAMRAVGIKGERAAALVHFGYGETREKCAEMAGVSIESIKRDLAKARQTPYAKFFARTRRQRLEARTAMKKPDDAFARMSQLAKEDPDALRSVIDQVIASAQGDSSDGSPWDKVLQSHS